MNINFHFPTCKYLILFTWATLGYSQVAQWIFSKLLKLDGKCRLIVSHFYTNLPSVHSSRKLELAPPPCLSQIFSLSSHWTRTANWSCGSILDMDQQWGLQVWRTPSWNLCERIKSLFICTILSYITM